MSIIAEWNHKNQDWELLNTEAFVPCLEIVRDLQAGKKVSQEKIQSALKASKKGTKGHDKPPKWMLGKGEDDAQPY